MKSQASIPRCATEYVTSTMPRNSHSITVSPTATSAFCRLWHSSGTQFAKEGPVKVFVLAVLLIVAETAQAPGDRADWLAGNWHCDSRAGSRSNRTYSS